MTSRNHSSKKKPKAPRRRGLPKFFLPALLGFLLLLSLTALLYAIFLRPASRPPSPTLPPKQKLAGEEQARPAPVLTPRMQKAVPQVRDSKPLLAIIIDDMGHNQQIGEALLNMPLDLSFAFLPQGPFTERQARLAQRKGRDILLHLPMQPTDPQWDPGPDALYTRLSAAAIRSRFEKNLAAVPMALGLNNHMGSRFTEDREAMAKLLPLVAGRGLFFLDSLTSADSIGYRMALTLGIRTAKRDIFLDNEQDPVKIGRQIEHLLQLARRQGSAIGIGHPHPATLQALAAAEQRLRTEVTLVGVHVLVH